MRFASGLVFALAAACFALPSAAAAQPTASTLQATVAHLPAPAPAPQAFILSLAAFAVAGTTGRAKTRTMSLSKEYLFNGELYGPGEDIEVPEEFPDIDGETGDVIWPEGSKAARNQAKGRRNFSTPPSTGGVNTGEGASGGSEGGTISGKTREQLEELDRGKLEKLAERHGLTVTRGDGQDGAPLKGDFVDALSAAK